MKGSLVFHYGPMGAGKTADIIEQVDIFGWTSDSYIPVICVPYMEGLGEKIHSRNGESLDIHYYLSEESIDTVINKLKKEPKHFVMIDEAQFLAPMVVLKLRQAADAGMEIHCYGLMTNFKGELFPGSDALVRFSDNLYRSQNILCECGRSAVMNHKADWGKELVDLDKNKYTARCFTCWNQ